MRTSSLEREVFGKLKNIKDLESKKVAAKEQEVSIQSVIESFSAKKVAGQVKTMKDSVIPKKINSYESPFY